MPHVITSLCMREGSCATVCPVDCIVPGNPQDQYPTYYIDPETCIDCGACVFECPYSAIFPKEDVPSSYTAKGGERISMPLGTKDCNETFEVIDHAGNPIQLKSTRTLAAGEILDLTPAIEANAAYFTSGPGYGK